MILGRDKICAVVAAPDAKSMAEQLQRALRQTSTVELRLDWLVDEAQVAQFLEHLAARKPRGTLIATCRRREGGGRLDGTIAEELFCLSEAIRAGCTWYDIEIESAGKCPPELLEVLLGGGRRLTSAHFFRRMPRNLEQVAAKLARQTNGGGRSQRGDAVKIAAQCDSLADSLKLLRLARTQKNVVAIPMGDVAQPARLLALRERNGFAYAPVENATAPGQIPLEEMKRVYRADQLNRATQIYGVIGDPIGHSLSPVMHNAGYQARKLNAVCLPFLVRDLGDFVRAIGPLGIRGFCASSMAAIRWRPRSAR